MTIADSLSCMTKINIDNIIEKICIDRNLDSTLEYDATYRVSIDYNLALADLYYQLYLMPDMKEQDITITLPERQYYFKRAQEIYSKYEESSFTGEIFGFVGSKFNKVR